MIGSVWPSLGAAVAGSILTWGLARAFGVHGSFARVLVASLATRLLISSVSILAGGGTDGYGSIGAFLVAPLLGLTAEVLTAQWEEDDDPKPTVTPTERSALQPSGQTSDWAPTVAVIRVAL